jgi:transcriptional regulator with XRE-family HTH domain
MQEVVGRRVRDLRERKDMSQADLGRAVGPFLGRAWSRQTMSFAEQGGRAWTAAELAVLAHLLETSVSLLFVPPAGDEDIELPGGARLTHTQMVTAALGVPGDLPAMDALAALADVAQNITEGYKTVVAGAQTMQRLLNDAQARAALLASASWSQEDK